MKCLVCNADVEPERIVLDDKGLPVCDFCALLAQRKAICASCGAKLTGGNCSPGDTQGTLLCARCYMASCGVPNFICNVCQRSAWPGDYDVDSEMCTACSKQLTTKSPEKPAATDPHVMALTAWRSSRKMLRAFKKVSGAYKDVLRRLQTVEERTPSFDETLNKWLHGVTACIDTQAQAAIDKKLGTLYQRVDALAEAPQHFTTSITDGMRRVNAMCANFDHRLQQLEYRVTSYTRSRGEGEDA